MKGIKLPRKFKNVFRTFYFKITSQEAFAFLRISLYSLLFILILPPLVLLITIKREYASSQYDSLDNIPKTRIAIVFGAGLKDKGTKPGVMLEDRLLSVVDLYEERKIEKILITGDNNKIDYDETSVMESFIINQGVKKSDIVVDESGKRTYDSCIRAKKYYGVNSAILVTQGFHLPRALYLCDSAGINVIGFTADKQNYSNIYSNRVREFFALPLAYWDIWVAPPEIIESEPRQI